MEKKATKFLGLFWTAMQTLYGAKKKE